MEVPQKSSRAEGLAGRRVADDEQRQRDPSLLELWAATLGRPTLPLQRHLLEGHCHSRWRRQGSKFSEEQVACALCLVSLQGR